MPIYQESDSSEDHQFSLSTTYATHNPALIILREKGYELLIIPDKDEGGSTYVAKASGRRFAATGGAELLGLIAIWENHGEDWNKQEPYILDELIPDEDKV
jgi:hypothetical protein